MTMTYPVNNAPNPFLIPPTEAVAMTEAEKGEHGKQQAFRLLKQWRAVYVRQARRALLKHLLLYGNGSMDDIRALVPLPPGINPKMFGAVPGDLARQGLIVSAGYSKSVRAEAHSRPLGRWAIVDAAAVNAWLDTHPELPADHLAPIGGCCD